MTGNPEITGEDGAHDSALKSASPQAAHSDRSVLKRGSRGPPFRPLKWRLRDFSAKFCAIFVFRLVVERLLQGGVAVR